MSQLRSSASRRSGAANAGPLERGQRGQEQLQAVARRQLQPARDREIAAGGEVGEIVGQRLDRVDEALVQADIAGAGGGEGVQQRQLDQVVALPAGGDEAARLGDVEPDLGALI